MYINMKSSKELINKLVKETLEQKYTNVTSSWSDLIDGLSKEIKKPIELDDAGNYNSEANVDDGNCEFQDCDTDYYIEAIDGMASDF